MAELTISAADIEGAIEDYVSSFAAESEREEIGTVVDAGDGIAHVEGLPSVMTQELLEFPGGVLGVALNLDEHSVGVVILGDFEKIEEGQQVKRTGEVLSVPVGDAYLGRVVNPLGEPIDAQGDIKTDTRRALELQAPSVVQRQSVSEPLQTGIKAIDSQTPIGRGQRQLIIGDRKTGKTAVCVDTILNQRENWETGDPHQQVRCVYVAIGQKGTTIASVKRALEEGGAMDYTTIVAAPASDSAGFKWLAPYTGSAIAQHWMYDGKHVLIVFDDLTKQAEAYRAISLLLRRPPGREAYPGDVFYLHSRLLERCAQAVRRARCRFADRSADHRDQGQRHLGLHPDQRHLDHRRSVLPGDRPVQPGCAAGHQRRCVGVTRRWRRPDQGHERGRRIVCDWTCRSTASWRPSRPSPPTWTPTSKAQLERGARLVELLKQPQYSPMSVEDQVVAIFLGTQGHLDSVPVEDVGRFEAEFIEHMKASHDEILKDIRETKKLPDEASDKLVDVINDFKKGFSATDGSSVVVEAEAEALDPDDVAKESVKVRKPAPKKK